jgi:hypothetical protein
VVCCEYEAVAEVTRSVFFDVRELREATVPEIEGYTIFVKCHLHQMLLVSFEVSLAVRRGYNKRGTVRQTVHASLSLTSSYLPQHLSPCSET